MDDKAESFRPTAFDNCFILLFSITIFTQRIFLKFKENCDDNIIEDITKYSKKKKKRTLRI